MTALEYMQRQMAKHSLNHYREFERGAPKDVLENIEKKVGYYAEAVEALKAVKEADGNDS